MQSIGKEESRDRVYTRISRGWSSLPPLATTMDLRFCSCKRQYKWSPRATINNLEYNRPIVTKMFCKQSKCAASYQRLFLEHKTHKDSVCYMVAIFCAKLATWCKEFNLTWNINKFNIARPEVLLATKHLYWTARWMRHVEAICSTYFVAGPHHTMINGFGNTRAKMMVRASQNYANNNVQLPKEENTVPRFEEDQGPHTSKYNWGASLSKHRKF